MIEILQKIVTAPTIISVLLVVCVIILCILLQRLKERYKRRHGEEPGGRETAARVTFGVLKFLILFIGCLTILQVNGVNVSGMFAGLGIASAIVGLALQDFLKDIIMGVNILSDHFFSMGECVEYNGREGVIVGMTLKTTKIGDLDDFSVTTVCNRNISEIRRLGDRLDIDVPLPYGVSVEKAAEALEKISETVKAFPDVTGCGFAGTESFESSAILYRLRITCEAKKRADVRRAANRAIQEGLRDAGIAIPFNQLDVHFDRAE